MRLLVLGLLTCLSSCGSSNQFSSNQFSEVESKDTTEQEENEQDAMISISQSSPHVLEKKVATVSENDNSEEEFSFPEDSTGTYLVCLPKEDFICDLDAPLEKGLATGKYKVSDINVKLTLSRPGEGTFITGTTSFTLHGSYINIYVDGVKQHSQDGDWLTVDLRYYSPSRLIPDGELSYTTRFGSDRFTNSSSRGSAGSGQ